MSNYQLRRGSASQLVAADHAARRGGSVLSPALPGTSCRGRANERANARWQGWDGRALGMPTHVTVATLGRGRSATGGQHRTLAVHRSADERWSGRAGQDGRRDRRGPLLGGSQVPILQALCRRYTPGRYAPAPARLATVHQRAQHGVGSCRRPAKDDDQLASGGLQHRIQEAAPDARHWRHLPVIPSLL